MALLQGGKRTATVTVARRTRAARDRQAGLRSLFLKNPKAIEHFARRAVAASRGRHPWRAHPARHDHGQRGQQPGPERRNARRACPGLLLADKTATDVALCRGPAGRRRAGRDRSSICRATGWMTSPRNSSRTGQGAARRPAALKVALRAGLDPEAYGDLHLHPRVEAERVRSASSSSTSARRRPA